MGMTLPPCAPATASRCSRAPLTPPRPSSPRIEPSLHNALPTRPPSLPVRRKQPPRPPRPPWPPWPPWPPSLPPHAPGTASRRSKAPGKPPAYPPRALGTARPPSYPQPNEQDELLLPHPDLSPCIDIRVELRIHDFVPHGAPRYAGAAGDVAREVLEDVEWLTDTYDKAMEGGGQWAVGSGR